MNWTRIIRRTVAVVLASALGVAATVPFAYDSLGWGNALGLGLFFMAIGIGAVTMVACHRVQRSG